MNKKIYFNNGITLIALIVTIIILIILAGVSISMLTGENGIIGKADIAKKATELSNYKEELEQWKMQKQMENNDFLEDTLSVGKNNLTYNGTQKDGNIKTIIPDLREDYLDEIEVIKGELVLSTTDTSKIKSAKIANIKINPYKIKDGELMSANENLELVSGDGIIVIPENVNKIGSGAFSGVKGLKKIIISENVKEIEPYAFANNQTLESVEIRGDLQKIGLYAFDGDINLQNINLPDSINYIGDRAFRKCNIREIVIPKSLKMLNFCVFENAKKLENVIFQEGLEEIKANVFVGAVFTSIQIPSSVKNIDVRAFNSCDNLIDIDVSKNSKFTYKDQSGMLIDNDNNILFISSTKLNSIKEFEIPDGITSFNNDISKYTNITKITLPSSLTYVSAYYLPSSINEVIIKGDNTNLFISDNMLYNKNNELIMCYSKEKEINIPEKIITINEGAFTQAIYAENINLPTTLNKISVNSIGATNKIKNLNIKQNVNYIDPRFTSGFVGNVNISSDNSKYEVVDNILYEKVDGKRKILVKVLYKLGKTFLVDSQIKEIGDYAFYNQQNLTEVSIPEGITTIGNSFRYCPNLLKIEIPKTVTSIKSGCFGDSTNSLTQIIIKNKENSIKGAPWSAVKGLKAVIWEN